MPIVRGQTRDNQVSRPFSGRIGAIPYMPLGAASAGRSWFSVVGRNPFDDAGASARFGATVSVAGGFERIARNPTTRAAAIEAVAIETRTGAILSQIVRESEPAGPTAWHST